MNSHEHTNLELRERDELGQRPALATLRHRKPRRVDVGQGRDARQIGAVDDRRQYNSVDHRLFYDSARLSTRKLVL